MQQLHAFRQTDAQKISDKQQVEIFAARDALYTTMKKITFLVMIRKTHVHKLNTDMWNVYFYINAKTIQQKKKKFQVQIYVHTRVTQERWRKKNYVGSINTRCNEIGVLF